MTGPSVVRYQPGPTDKLLIGVYLVGIYLGIAASLPGGIPLPAVLAGAAGLALLARHASRIRTVDLICLIVILCIVAASVLFAPDYGLLGERFKGIIQFGYSIAIGFGFYLAARSLSAAWLGRLCLALCLAILILATLENALPAMRQVSDTFRGWVFESGVYASDRRDIALYGRIRPKVFTSEPSFVTLGFTMFAFARYVLSRGRYKIAEYVALLALGYLMLRGPTILLGVLLIPVYEVLLAPRRGGTDGQRFNWSRALPALVAAGLIAVLGPYLATMLFEERVANILSGTDSSVFARIIAPPLVAWEIILEHPVAGVGLTGWEHIETTVQQLYATSNWLATDFQFESAAHAITNWFWLHWIFFGLFFGVLVIIAFTVLLRVLDVPSALFCWAVWAVFGQAAGSYVGPRTWTIFFLAAAISVIHQRDVQARQTQATGRPAPYPAAGAAAAGWRLK